jgi:hypothetical protein
MLVKEYITQELELLSATELQQLAEYLAFIKFRSRLRPLPAQMSEEKLQSLYAEFESEDLILAEAGLEEYVAVLAHEDEA